MTKAILATFSDAKAIKGRSVFQIILELPIEQADDALKALGGWPQPSESRWVGIALSKQEREKIETEAAPKEQHKDRRPFNTLPLSQQAALRCGDSAFQRFLAPNGLFADMDHVATVLRQKLGISSRAELDTDADAAQRWRSLDGRFSAWLTDQQYAESMR